MTDLSDTIAAKSDQLNADDLIERPPLTIKITRVSKLKDEQPIAISYEGDGGKPYKPGKSMRRVLVALWGKNGDNYVGRSMTLYRDPEVTFGKLKVGGIRISHMTNINGEQRPVITVKQGQKREFIVKPLVLRDAVPMPANVAAEIAAATTRDDLVRIRDTHSGAAFWPDVDQATRRRIGELPTQETSNEGPEERGEAVSEADRPSDAGGDDYAGV